MNIPRIAVPGVPARARKGRSFRVLRVASYSSLALGRDVCVGACTANWFATRVEGHRAWTDPMLAPQGFTISVCVCLVCVVVLQGVRVRRDDPPEDHYLIQTPSPLKIGDELTCCSLLGSLSVSRAFPSCLAQSSSRDACQGMLGAQGG